MNKDLEETLDELGPGYRTVASRLLAAREVEPASSGIGVRPSFDNRLTTTVVRLWRPLLAASVVVALGLSFMFLGSSKQPDRAERFRVYTVAYAPTEEALELIVATQRADGSWTNDFLTRQNAAALRSSQDARMRIAYRRAVRYLRSKGLAPLSDAELRARGENAAKALAGLG